jgi:Ca2+-binding RTX toxin-like protein
MAIITESFEGVLPSGNVGFFPPSPYFYPGLLSPHTFQSGVVQLIEPLGGLAAVGDFTQGDANFGAGLAPGDVPGGSAYLALDTDSGLLRLKFEGKKVYTVGAYVNTKSGDDPGMAVYDKNGKLISAVQVRDVPFSDWDSNYVLLVSKKPIGQVAFVGAFVTVDDLIINTSKTKLVLGTGGNDNLTSECTNKAEFVDGKGGNDKVNAKGGDDTVDLGSGKNKAQGGDGNDAFICTEGRYTLEGGDGQDSVVIREIDGLFVVVKDFNPADDTFFIDASLFPGLPPGALDPSRFVVGEAAVDADDRIIYDPTTGTLRYVETDGGAAVEFGKVNAGTALSELDFTFL